METVISRIAAFLGILATLATLVMMIGIVVDVFFRALYDRSVPGILELSESALVAAVFLGMAYTGATNSHIAVDLLTEKLPERPRQTAILVAWLATVPILGWMLWATFQRALAATAENELRMGLVNWPLWPSRWLIVIGLAAMLLVALVNVVRVLRGRTVLGEDSPEHLPDSPMHPIEYAEK